MGSTPPPSEGAIGPWWGGGVVHMRDIFIFKTKYKLYSGRHFG